MDLVQIVRVRVVCVSVCFSVCRVFQCVSCVSVCVVCLSACHVFMCVSYVSDIQQLVNSCPHLKELDLSDATMLSSASVECIAASLGGLEYIALSRCYRIMPSSLT